MNQGILFKFSLFVHLSANFNLACKCSSTKHIGAFMLVHFLCHALSNDINIFYPVILTLAQATTVCLLLLFFLFIKTAFSFKNFSVTVQFFVAYDESSKHMCFTFFKTFTWD